MRRGTPSALFPSLPALAFAALIAAPAGAAQPAEAPGAARIAPARETELARFVRQDCGSCHGLTLRGGLGPSLTPEALAGRPPEYLRAMILDGRRGTAMPGWRPLLSEAEAAWIADALLRGVPDVR